MALEREVDPLTLVALGGVFYPVIMVRIDWPDGEVYANTNSKTITWDANSYTGVSFLGSLEIPEETGGIVTAEASLTIAGYLENLLDTTEINSRNRQVNIYVGLTTKVDGDTLVGDPVEIFSGYLDENELIDAPSGNNRSHTLKYGISSGPSARASASINHTYEDQIGKYVGDTLFRHVIHAIARVNNPAIFPEP